MTVSWGERWRSVLGGPDHELVRRVRQGRATYRSGRVSDVRLAAGRVSARVQGSRATPFLVEVEIPLLSDEDWDVVIDLLAGKVRYRARLLAGHEPEGLAEEAEAAGVRLFPSMDEIAVAAGHSGESPFPVVGAGVWEAVAARLDSSPFPLLKLRGRGRERILRDIARRRRDGEANGPLGVPVEEIDLLGWSSERSPLGAVAVPRVRIPRTDAPQLQVLGDPEGWAGALSAADLFGPLVAGGAAEARKLLTGADEVDELVEPDPED
jgi:hypothetical protein